LIPAEPIKSTTFGAVLEFELSSNTGSPDKGWLQHLSPITCHFLGMTKHFLRVARAHYVFSTLHYFRRTRDEVPLAKQLNQKKKAEKQTDHATPTHLSKKQTVGWDRILAQIIEKKMKWRARWDSNPRHPA
jgi:hypothetical protein